LYILSSDHPKTFFEKEKDRSQITCPNEFSISYVIQREAIGKL